MFRKRRRATPNFKISPPYNPMHGEQANLRQEGTSPFCAMMQVADTDTYADYVICRGFDPRILKFIDYAVGDANRPGISVAKPYGKRKVGTYTIGEVYPALLPTQGNADFTNFRQVTYTPPSPVDVEWRVGQNPGVVVGGLDGGHPASLSEAIQILYDHNGKVVNWILVDGGGKAGTSLLSARMTESWTSRQATCEIYTLDGPNDPVYLETEEVYDPLSVLAALSTGDWMYILLASDGKYYINPAGCPGTCPLIADPPATQP